MRTALQCKAVADVQMVLWQIADMLQGDMADHNLYLIEDALVSGHSRQQNPTVAAVKQSFRCPPQTSCVKSDRERKGNAGPSRLAKQRAGVNVTVLRPLFLGTKGMLSNPNPKPQR